MSTTECYQHLFDEQLLNAALMTVLECSQPDAAVYTFTQPPAVQASATHDVAAESDLFARLHASGLIVLYENCSSNTPCVAMPGMINQLPEEGLLAAPGIKLYVHRKKWKQPSMRVYEDNADEDDAGDPV